MFPEGGTTNGTSLLKFKKGAFSAEKRVTPIIQLYDTDGSVSIAYDIIEVLVLAILQLSWCGYYCKIIRLPDFEPNEYLFETHFDKGQDRWEIFAWAVRDAMQKAGKFQLSDMPLREKLVYEKYMQMHPKVKSPYYQPEDTQASVNGDQQHLKENTSNKKDTDLKPVENVEMQNLEKQEDDIEKGNIEELKDAILEEPQ